MFCYSCRYFSLPGFDSNGEEAFIKTGFRRWKKAHGKNGEIPKHTALSATNVLAWKDYEQNKAKHTTVEQVLNDQYQKKVQENRHYIKTVGEVILTTAIQIIAQRGHREGDDVINPGNVTKFLKLIAKHDPVVSNRVATGLKNEKYTSVAVQNEIIGTFVTMVLEEKI